MTEILNPETLKPVPAEDIEAKFQAVKEGPAETIPAPKRMTPERKEEVRSQPRRTRTRAPKQDKPKTAPRASTPAVDEERAQSVADTMNLAAGGLMMGYAANKDKNPALATALAADAVTLSTQAETFGTACANLAKHSPGFARLIDGSGKAGPWFAFSTACFTIGAQIAVNHGALPVGLLGTANPSDLAAMVENGQDNNPDR